MGAHRLSARARVPDPARRGARRPLRPAADLRDRHGLVRRSRPCSAARRRTSRCWSSRASCKGSAPRCSRRGASPSCRRASARSDRAEAVGAWSGLGGVAGAIGPFVGGWLVDGPGWRWAFLINVPVAAIVVVCARIAVPETRDPHAARGLDLTAPALAVVSLGAATWALTEAGPEGGPTPASSSPARSRRRDAGAFVYRMLHTRRSARAARAVPQSRVHRDEPRDRAAVRRDRRVVLPRRLRAAGRRRVVGVASRASRSCPTTVLMLVFSAKSGELAQRIGPRVQLTVGPLLVAAGLLLLVASAPDTSWPPTSSRRNRVRARARDLRRAAHRHRHGLRRAPTR